MTELWDTVIASQSSFTAARIMMLSRIDMALLKQMTARKRRVDPLRLGCALRSQIQGYFDQVDCVVI